MIGHVRGIVDRYTDYGVVLDVHGIGYIVACPVSVKVKLSIGQSTSLYTHTHINETSFDLYGFENESQLGLFRMLISVSGIGPKSALNIMGLGNEQQIASAISSADEGYLSSASGIGKRTAQRVIVELRDKVGAVGIVERGMIGTAFMDVVDALIAMGYSAQQAREVVTNLDHANKKVEDLIREALMSMTRMGQ